MINRTISKTGPKPEAANSFWQAYQARRAAQNAESARTVFPQIRDPLAVAYVAVTVVIMAYSSLFGVYPILLFYAIWFPHLLYKGRMVLRPSAELLLPTLFAGYSVFSILWSGYPAVTARASLELISMLAATFILSRIVSVAAFMKGLAAGSALVLIATLINDNYAQDYFSGSYSLVGLFGSKNQVGFVAEAGLYAALLYIFTKSSLSGKIALGVIPFLIAIVCLVLSSSATSVASLMIALIASASAYLLAKLGRGQRLPIAILGFFLIALVAVAAAYLGEKKTMFHALGRDATLTGRTYLWAEGTKVGFERPLLGHGYAAFWVPGQAQAERYWYDFGIYDRTGFHFHNLFVQTFVDLGAVGLLLMVLLIGSALFKSLRCVLERKGDIESMFSLGICAMLIARAFVEVDFLGPFGLGPLLFFSLAPRLALARDAPVSEAPTPKAKPYRFFGAGRKERAS